VRTAPINRIAKDMADSGMGSLRQADSEKVLHPVMGLPRPAAERDLVREASVARRTGRDYDPKYASEGITKKSPKKLKPCIV